LIALIINAHPKIDEPDAELLFSISMSVLGLRQTQTPTLRPDFHRD